MRPCIKADANPLRDDTNSEVLQPIQSNDNDCSLTPPSTAENLRSTTSEVVVDCC
jgi:hypothetical protein